MHSLTRHYRDLRPQASGPADLEETKFDTEMSQMPKRLRRIQVAVRSTSLPIAVVAVRSRRAKQKVQRKHKRMLLHRASSGGGVRGMQIDS